MRYVESENPYFPFQYLNLFHKRMLDFATSAHAHTHTHSHTDTRANKTHKQKRQKQLDPFYPIYLCCSLAAPILYYKYGICYYNILYNITAILLCIYPISPRQSLLRHISNKQRRQPQAATIQPSINSWSFLVGEII